MVVRMQWGLFLGVVLNWPVAKAAGLCSNGRAGVESKARTLAQVVFNGGVAWPKTGSACQGRLQVQAMRKDMRWAKTR